MKLNIPTLLAKYLPTWLTKRMALANFFIKSYLNSKTRGFKNTEHRKNIISIRPEDIKVYLETEFQDIEHQGLIRSGNWDLRVKTVFNHPFAAALNDHLKHGVSWENTDYYKYLLSKLNKGDFPFDCKSENDLRMKFNRWEKLYINIKENKFDLSKTFFDVAINIGRNGELILNGNIHKILIATQLNVPTIPVIVNTRHSRWVSFHNQVLYYIKRHKLYSPITHPDLAYMPSKYTSERADIIIKYLKNTKEYKTILDIGANWGYFCHRLEEKGFQCTAVELGIFSFYFLSKLQKALSRKFVSVNESIFDFTDSGNISYDIVLALGIFHHFLIDKVIFNRFVQMLQKLRMRFMFFESTHLQDKQMQSSCHKFSSQDDYADFIIDNTVLTRKELLNRSHSNRNLYVLY